MARVRMVTRTIEFTNCEVLCLDVVSCEPSVHQYTITGTYEDTTAMMKQLKNEYETESFKLVNINSYEVVEQLYGMLESEFIKLADKLESR